MSKSKVKIKTIEYNPICDPKRMHGYKNVRWVENASCGLRLVGFADEVARKEGSRRSIDHTGWFTQDDGYDGSKYRGVVYQLPGRSKTQYVYGYADPNNDDCALLCFDPETEVMEAARAADRFAEIFAEHERDYNRAWQAGSRFSDLGEEVKSMRTEALSLAEEMRAAKKTGITAPTICNVLRGKIVAIYRAIQKARKERAELMDLYGSEAAFKETCEG